MIVETLEGLKVLKGLNGQEALFINSSKIDECIEYLYKNNLKHISINPYQGYKLKEINFLLDLKDYLEGITILDEKFDYSIINELHKLKSLGFSDNKKDIIELSNFPNLEKLASDYTIRLKGLETCEKLKILTLTGFKSKIKNLSELSMLSELKELLLIQSNIETLEGIEHFKMLEKLEIFMSPKLEKISSLQNLSNNFTEFQVEKSKKIQDFEILGKIKSIKKLILSESGEIKNLSFVKELPNLEFISFWGTNVLDGDISYCEGIDYVGFDNKNHYTHKIEQFKETNIKNTRRP